MWKCFNKNRTLLIAILSILFLAHFGLIEVDVSHAQDSIQENNEGQNTQLLDNPYFIAIVIPLAFVFLEFLSFWFLEQPKSQGNRKYLIRTERFERQTTAENTQRLVSLGQPVNEYPLSFSQLSTAFARSENSANNPVTKVIDVEQLPYSILDHCFGLSLAVAAIAGQLSNYLLYRNSDIIDKPISDAIFMLIVLKFFAFFLIYSLRITSRRTSNTWLRFVLVWSANLIGFFLLLLSFAVLRNIAIQ
jgi:hypothetical protein